MNAIVTAVIGMIGHLLPLITSASNAVMIESILNTLASVLPFVVEEAQALAGPIKNIIAALSANPATTAEQLKTLQDLDKQVDTAFEAAAAETDAEQG